MKKLVCLVLALLLCSGSALADVVIPELPGVVEKNSGQHVGDCMIYSAKGGKFSEKDLEKFVAQLESLGFRNEGSQTLMEFTYPGKRISGVTPMKGRNTKDDVYVTIQWMGFGFIYVKVVDGIRVDGDVDIASSATADTHASATETVTEKHSAREMQVFTVCVKIGDEWRGDYQIETDEEYVLDVLLERGLVEGEEAAWGFNVTTVDGIKADYERKGEYWSILKYDAASGDFMPLQGSLSSEKINAWASYCFVLEQ